MTDSRITEELAYFIDRALDGMSMIVTTLGDEKANRAPDLPCANSPYVILMHCLGVMEYWVGHIALGRPSNRDRPAEFRAKGNVAGLVEKVNAAKVRLREDLTRVRLADDVAIMPPPPYDSPTEDLTQSTVLLHVLEEMAQHHGQMEITRDVLLNR